MPRGLTVEARQLRNATLLRLHAQFPGLTLRQLGEAVAESRQVVWLVLHGYPERTGRPPGRPRKLRRKPPLAPAGNGETPG